MSDFTLSISVPENISSKIDLGDIYPNYTKAGYQSSYGVDLEFTEMKLFKTLKSGITGSHRPSELASYPKLTMSRRGSVRAGPCGPGKSSGRKLRP